MILFLLLAVLAGAMLPVQTGVNVQLRGLLGQPLAAALVSFLVGTLGLAAVVALLRVPVPVGAAWGRSAWWHWSGGLLGAAYIAVTIVLAPRLGGRRTHRRARRWPDDGVVDRRPLRVGRLRPARRHAASARGRGAHRGGRSWFADSRRRGLRSDRLVSIR
jgi:hypothetical protein